MKLLIALFLVSQIVLAGPEIKEPLTLYHLLGVDPKASLDTMESIAFQHVPGVDPAKTIALKSLDRPIDTPTAKENRILAAYQILKNPITKAAYDAYLKTYAKRTAAPKDGLFELHQFYKILEVARENQKLATALSDPKNMRVRVQASKLDHEGKQLEKELAEEKEKNADLLGQVEMLQQAATIRRRAVAKSQVASDEEKDALAEELEIAGKQLKELRGKFTKETLARKAAEAQVKEKDAEIKKLKERLHGFRHCAGWGQQLALLGSGLVLGGGAAYGVYHWRDEIRDFAVRNGIIDKPGPAAPTTPPKPEQLIIDDGDEK